MEHADPCSSVEVCWSRHISQAGAPWEKSSELPVDLNSSGAGPCVEASCLPDKEVGSWDNCFTRGMKGRKSRAVLNLNFEP